MIDVFYRYARDRHSIYIKRKMRLPRAEWTDDPILQRYRFTNVFRELDATTIWFRDNVRDPLRSKPDVLLATTLFRWFNRIQTGEAIFNQKMLNETPGDRIDEYRTPWEWAQTGAPLDVVGDAIRAYCGKGPYVTGAYIIKTPDGKNKLDGVLWCVEQFITKRYPFPSARVPGIPLSWLDAAKVMNDGRQWTLEETWGWLRQFPYLGDFMAYEIVTDLRHTALLEHASDIMTWANPGPGAMRGLNRIHRRPLTFSQAKHKFITEMYTVFSYSWIDEYWPQDWPKWEMRDVEHTLCEYDKYQRVLLGEGRPRNRFP